MLNSIQNSPDYLFFKNLDIKGKLKYISYLIRKTDKQIGEYLCDKEIEKVLSLKK